MDNGTFGKLEQTTLSQRASAELLRFIGENGLAPGDSLPSASSLAEQFGVSRTVIREALQHLQGQGIIRTINGRTSQVRGVGPNVLQVYFRHALNTVERSHVELMEVRRGLEVEAARLCALRRAPGDLEELSRLIQSMASTSDLNDYAELDARFHLAIASFSGNTVLRQLLFALRDQLREASVMGLKNSVQRGVFEQVQIRHDELFAAIAAQDPDAAMSAMLHHMNDAESYLAEVVA
ncbi:MAG: FadR/GntR family transcriptional regulator [Tropicimonas sp.]|uniref:FadR/GntR family transcriptional regulator n=1 Tax=Tropicimonas sp. TaxID=2067044 RepID=UPI003A8C2E95